jgi:lactate dehydrogenase-like 2-hydroxyacid dehydrogenase
MRILWPRFTAKDTLVEQEVFGSDVQLSFYSAFDQVSDEQWANADGLVGPSPPERYVEKLRNCRIYAKPSVGYDDVNLELYARKGIRVCNTPDYGTREVADHAMALMLTLCKSIAFHDESLRADLKNNWRPALNPFGRRLSVLTFGVVGIGRIGTAAARRAKAFDMDVVFYDPYQPSGYDQALGVRRVDTLAELMAQSDIVSIHTPLNPQTRKLIGREALAAAKRGMIIVNTARGPVIDLDALHDAMKDGTVLAAGLDVLPEEPANPAAPLIAAWQANEPWLKHRLVITPHSAYFTPESVRDTRALSARTVARFLRDGRLDNCVNLALLSDPK